MSEKRNTRFHVPEPPARPDGAPDFSWLDVPPLGAVAKPDIGEGEERLRHLPYTLIRCLEEGAVGGDWVPEIPDETLLHMLRVMVQVRVLDQRLFTAQRQGKTSFYMKSSGEEAISVAASLALRADDMSFPTYRFVGWLLARDYPLLKLVNQIFNNADDPLQGRQLPVLYSARDYGFYSLSGNLGSRLGHAVGWAMAKAYRGADAVAMGVVGEGTTAEGNFHEALTFAATYRAPVILGITNNQWAISSYSGIAGGEETTFAAKALAYGLPGLRVDGNDILAVWAAVKWAADRARAGHGATLIEFVTYRAEGHSTADDPARYRPKDEASHWPLGDPVERLKAHLIARSIWDEDRHTELAEELETEIRRVIKEGEAVGVLGSSKPSVDEMFKHVFAEPDWRLEEQRRELES